MNNENSRSKELFNKVYDYLDGIDVSKLSLSELGAFLEVVQKGQFLESVGKFPSFAPWGGSYYGFGGTGTGPDHQDAAETKRSE